MMPRWRADGNEIYFVSPEREMMAATVRASGASFEADKPVRVQFEQGGNAAFSPGTPEPNFVAEFDAWPIPEAEAVAWQQPGVERAGFRDVAAD